MSLYGDWAQLVTFIIIFVAFIIERTAHGRYMYRLALSHVDEETTQNAIESGYPVDAVDLRFVIAQLRKKPRAH